MLGATCRPEHLNYFQVLLGERDEHQVLFEKLQEEASHMTSHPEVTSQLHDVTQRWDYVCNASDDRNQLLMKVRNLL